MTPPSLAAARSTATWAPMVGLVLVAANLRAAISSVPEVSANIAANLGWSDAALGALTTIPVITTGLVALSVPALSNVFGRSRTVALALAVLSVALGARLFSEVAWILPVSACAAGIGIALAAGLVPGIVREQMPGAMGKATATWSAVLMLGAAAGGAVTVPIALWTGSWSIALAFWAIPALAAFIGWMLIERPTGGHERHPGASVRLSALPWRSRPAWALTAYLTLNSVIFYSTIAWLGPSYHDRGWGQAAGGELFGLYTLAQVAAAIILPPLADRARFRRSIFAATIIMTAAAMLLIGFAPDWMPYGVLILGGLGIGGSFSLGLVLLSEYSRDARGSARLTAMAFFVTYTLAAFGPLITGLLLQGWDSWSLVYSFLAVMCILQLVTIIPLKRGVTIG